MSYASAPPAAYTKRARSTPAALVLGTAYNFTHGLGAKPRGAQVKLICTTIDGGWAVGDEIVIAPYYDAGYRGINLGLNNDGTTVTASVGSSNMDYYNKTASAGYTVTAANWSLVFECWL